MAATPNFKHRPTVLTICDGWGVGPDGAGNAIARARTPNFTRFLQEFPHTTLSASGEDVGLPAGQMGNSEVGHLNLGAGRMVPQDILRIDLSIRDGGFFSNPALVDACRRAKRSGSAFHLLGLLSDGGVHSHEAHLFALLELARREKLTRVFVHAFLDGRDTPPRSAALHLARLEATMEEKETGAVATVSGRYYAMDRDSRWDREKKAFDAMVHGEGEAAISSAEALARAYDRGETDEFVLPTVVRRGGRAAGTIAKGDSVIFFNFRADRARQMTRALTEREFSEFDRRGESSPFLVCMTEYNQAFSLPVAFPPVRLTNILAEVWEKAGVRNLRLAETEKYAHVTYFFNGGVEREFRGESRILIPSKKVATYDLAPAMSAPEITEEALRAIASDQFDAIVMNYANADMVGHTGKIEPAIEAIECLDGCLGRVAGAILERGGAFLMTGDHGNAEQMIDPQTGAPHTAHTTNPVPLIAATRENHARLSAGGSLRDVAPTILALMDIPAPPEMTGKNLFNIETEGDRR